MAQDPEIRDIQDEHHERHRLLRCWTIVEEADGRCSVYHHTHDSVAPTSTKPNRLAAAARVVQMLGLDMVAAQQEPEIVGIGQ